MSQSATLPYGFSARRGSENDGVANGALSSPERSTSQEALDTPPEPADTERDSLPHLSKSASVPHHLPIHRPSDLNGGGDAVLSPLLKNTFGDAALQTSADVPNAEFDPRRRASHSATIPHGFPERRPSVVDGVANGALSSPLRTTFEGVLENHTDQKSAEFDPRRRASHSATLPHGFAERRPSVVDGVANGALSSPLRTTFEEIVDNDTEEKRGEFDPRRRPSHSATLAYSFSARRPSVVDGVSNGALSSPSPLKNSFQELIDNHTDTPSTESQPSRRSSNSATLPYGFSARRPSVVDGVSNGALSSPLKHSFQETIDSHNDTSSAETQPRRRSSNSATLPYGFSARRPSVVDGVSNGALSSPLKTTFEEALDTSDEMTDSDSASFPQELPGWNGYVEWEKYPERKERAAKILKEHEGEFDGFPEFQLEPLPKRNPILLGERWKQYHDALGLSHLYEQSWDTVKEEKAEDMTHVLQFPYNGEPPHDRLMADPFTNNRDFFVRNHGGVPHIDKNAWFVEIDGLVNNPQSLTLADLQDETKFPCMSVVSTIQCSGTRRIEQIDLYPGDGDELINAPWGEGAIGCARWTGVSLKKVIKYCGGLQQGGKHLEFFGADSYYKKGAMQNYVVSVPWRKVKVHEVMLAWEMNGKPLPYIHGYPVRVVVFGYIGARSVKWLTRIRALPTESRAPVQKKEYLYYTNQMSKYNSSYSAGWSIQAMPVSSAFMKPSDKEVIVHDGKIFCQGWAYSGKGFPARVEVSVDGGAIWYETDKLSQKYYHAWRLWEAWVPVDAEGWVELCVRCWDDAMNTQPTFQRSAWNWDLHVTHSCHRMKLFSVNRSKPRTKKRLEAMERAGEPLLPLTKPLGIEPESDAEYEFNISEIGGRDPEE